MAGVYSYSPALRGALPELLGAWRAQGHVRISMDVNGHEAQQLSGVKVLLPLLDVFKGNMKEAFGGLVGRCIEDLTPFCLS